MPRRPTAPSVPRLAAPSSAPARPSRRAALLLATTCAALCALRTPAARAAVVGDPTPGLAARTDTGAVSLDALRGRVVWLVYRASWCDLCRLSVPWMNAMQSRYGAHGLEGLAVNLDAKAEPAHRVLAEHPASFAIGFDPSGDTARRFALRAMPTSVPIGADGRVPATRAGCRASDRDALEATIRDALARRTASAGDAARRGRPRCAAARSGLHLPRGPVRRPGRRRLQLTRAPPAMRAPDTTCSATEATSAPVGGPVAPRTSGATAPALLAAALSLPGAHPEAVAQAPPERARIDVRWLHHQVVQPGLKRIRVDSPFLGLRVSTDERWSFDGTIGRDAVSGASPRWHPSVSGSSRMHDDRTSGDVRVTRHWDRATLTLGGAASSEDDFRSRALSLRGAWSTEDDNRTRSAGVGRADDRIDPVNRILVDERRRTTDLPLGATQALTPVDVVQAMPTHAHGEGYCSAGGSMTTAGTCALTR
jgi:hypothetical protein